MRIRAYATLRDLMGGAVHDTTISDSTTVGDVLERLAESHPAFGEKLWDANRQRTGFITVLLNGRSIEYLQGLDSPVTDADALALFPPVGGG